MSLDLLLTPADECHRGEQACKQSNWGEISLAPTMHVEFPEDIVMREPFFAESSLPLAAQFVAAAEEGGY
jgi:hypothetical protein